MTNALGLEVEGENAPHLRALITFACVARHMNFSRASTELAVTPTAVSRTIKELERVLDVRLFNRTTRSVALTEAGSQLFESLSPALDQIQKSVSQVKMSASRPTGTLRLNISYVAYSILFAPHLDRFLKMHPEINLEFSLDNQLTDVVAEGFDAGIRLGHAIHRDMIAIPLGLKQKRIVVASPSYLASARLPQRPEDLLDHDCIRQRRSSNERLFEWDFQIKKKTVRITVQGRLIFDEMRAVMNAAVDGLGIAYVFEEFAEQCLRNKRLIPLLEGYQIPGENFYLYYPNRAQMPGKLRALIDFMQD